MLSKHTIADKDKEDKYESNANMHINDEDNDETKSSESIVIDHNLKTHNPIASC